MVLPRLPVRFAAASLPTALAPSHPTGRSRHHRSCQHHPSPSRARLVSAGRGRTRLGDLGPLLLAALLCTIAMLVAPENPHLQEAICQRQSGVAACRVW